MSPSGSAITFERFQGSVSDPDLATAQTVELMCRYISESITDPLVQAAAAQAAKWGSPWAGAFWFTKHLMKFQSDESLTLALLNENDNLELLITPSVMLRSSKPQGDCDDFVMLVCSLLCCLGCDYEVVTVAADPQDPSRFSHVYCRAVLDDGLRIPIDASHGKFPGWQVPPARTFRTQVWDSAGNPIQDVAAGVQ
jgi:hypothetical protein